MGLNNHSSPISWAIGIAEDMKDRGQAEPWAQQTYLLESVLHKHVTREMKEVLKSYDMAQENAARSLGAPRWKAFLTITLPQIRFAVVTSALLAFLTSFDEVVVAMFISGGDNPTLTRNMFNALRDQIDPTIAAISTLMILLTTGLMVLAQLFGQNRKD